MGIEDTGLFSFIYFPNLEKHYFLLFFFFFRGCQRASLFELIRTTEVAAFSLPMIIGKYQAYKTRFVSAKTICLRTGLEIFLSAGFQECLGKLLERRGKNFSRNPKRFF
ncbi:MAG: hypothetical protein DI622_10490 [Chryseobacterium sp.]|nr:MAG: hypothetical protein DI622_10490 [Chryseobacterium sp.]PZU89063.1 MAG: hypothetical protein DI529_05015 [Chryseobacterium sp.]